MTKHEISNIKKWYTKFVYFNNIVFKSNYLPCLTYIDPFLFIDILDLITSLVKERHAIGRNRIFFFNKKIVTFQKWTESHYILKESIFFVNLL